MGVPTYGAIILDETLENVSVIKEFQCNDQLLSPYS